MEFFTYSGEFSKKSGAEDKNNKPRGDVLYLAAGAVFLLIFFFGPGFIFKDRPGRPELLAVTATTTLRISICGNGLVEPPEVCDSGSSAGQYSTSTAHRTCNVLCTGWSPYCGDGILNSAYGEGCDDGNNSPANLSTDFCNADCTVAAGVSTGAGIGGGGGFIGGTFTPPSPTKVVISGKAYPNSNVNILKDGAVLGIVKADAKADFTFSTENISPGVVTFGFWAQDQLGLKSIAFTMTFRVVPNVTTNVSGAFLPPTISVDKRSVDAPSVINFSGQSVPSSTIFLHINSPQEIIETTSSDNLGKWSIPFYTGKIAEEGAHTAKAAFEIKEAAGILRSGFSQVISFFVGREARGKLKSDINNDGRVNLIDFSILIFHWGTGRAEADLNGDGRVNLADFSILLFYWTG